MEVKVSLIEMSSMTQRDSVFDNQNDELSK